MSLISVLESINVAQLLNATCAAAISGCFSFFRVGGLPTTLAAIVLVTVIFPVTKIYASE